MIVNAIHWNVDPIAIHIGSGGLRWYSLGFLLAFLLGVRFIDLRGGVSLQSGQKSK